MEDIKENLIDRRTVDKMALNLQNLTAYNSALSGARSTWKKETYIASVFGETDFILECWPLDKEKNEKDDIAIKKMTRSIRKRKKKKKEEKMVNVAEAHLVVATLITTITFAADITVPGGFEGGNDQYPGSAVLMRSAVFKAFVVFDVKSIVSSSCAIFIHLLVQILMLASFDSGVDFLQTALLLIMFAMGTMVLAFATGTYVVLAHSTGLAITSCLIALSFFLIICLVFQIFLKMAQRYGRH